MVRINKSVARKAYNNGDTLYVLPCKTRVDNGWINPFAMNIADDTETSDFDRRINNYSYYNCNSELGNRCAYYVRTNA